MAKKQSKTEAQAELSVTREHVVKPEQLYKTVAAIDKAIDNAKIGTNNIMIEYQKIACSVINHLLQHKDITVVRNLLDNFPEGFRKVAMSGFVDFFAPVTFELDKTTKKVVIHFSKERYAKLDSQQAKAALLDAACNQTWWNMRGTEEKAYVPFNLHAALKRILVTAKRHLDQGGTSKGDYISIDMVTQLEAFTNKIEPKDEATTVNNGVAATTERAAA